MAKSKKERLQAHALRKKQNRERQSEYLAQLAALRLTDEEKALMRSTKHFGQKMTKKDQLREDIIREKIGLEPIHMHLYKEVTVDDTAFEDHFLTLPVARTDGRDSPAGNPEQEPAIKSSKGAELVATNTSAIDEANEELDHKKGEDDTVLQPTPSYDVQGNIVVDEDMQMNLYPERLIDSLLYTENTAYPSFTRSPAIEAERRRLPSFCMHHEFLETIGKTDVILVKGSTGSGKSTQIPQFLLEGGYSSLTSPYKVVGEAAYRPERDARYGFGGRIVVTQPRRIAAIGVSTRIAEELGESVGDTSGYIIKQSSMVDKLPAHNSRIVFVTEGVLLRMIEADFLLSDVSIVILDEAHERTINLDLLVGLMGRISSMRRRLFNRWLRQFEGLIVELEAVYRAFKMYSGPQKPRNGRLFGDIGGGDALAAQRYRETEAAEEEDEGEGEENETEAEIEEDASEEQPSTDTSTASATPLSQELTFQNSRRCFQESIAGHNPSLEFTDQESMHYHYYQRLMALAKLCQTPPPATPLKLIIMSATLHQEEIMNSNTLFHCKPLVFEIPMRTYPVAIHYSFATDENYVQAAIDKAITVHKHYNPGSILIFLSGKREIEYCINQLSEKLLPSSSRKHKNTSTEQELLRAKISGKVKYTDAFDNAIFDQMQDEVSTDDEQEGNQTNPVLKLMKAYVADVKAQESSQQKLIRAADAATASQLPDPKLLSSKDASTAILDNEAAFKIYNIMLNGAPSGSADAEQDQKDVAALMEEFKGCEKKRTKSEGSSTLVPIILPLYGTLDVSEQAKLFSSKYQDQTKYRLIVVSTNVAEASVTLPNIRYVIDSGKAKEKQEYNAIAALTIQFISKANADQRAGRAGRMAPGHCFRLYTPGLLQRMHDFPVPEVLRLPLSGLILSMLKIGVIDVHSFPFVTHPGYERLTKALSELVVLDAISETMDGVVITNLYKGLYDVPHNDTPTRTADKSVNYTLSKLGNLMAAIPLGPRMSKLVIKAVVLLNDKGDMLGPSFFIYAVLLASCYYSQLATTMPVRWPLTSGSGDALSKLFTVCALLCFRNKAAAASFCTEHKLRYDEAQQILSTAAQIFRILNVPPLDALLTKMYSKIPTSETIIKTVKATTPSTFTPEIRAALNWLLLQSFPDQIAFRESPDSAKYTFQGVAVKTLLDTSKEYRDLRPLEEVQGANRFNLTTEQVDLFLQYKPYTSLASVSRLSDIFEGSSRTKTLASLPTCIMYTSARAELYVNKELEAAANTIDQIKKCLRISVQLEGVIEVDKALICEATEFLTNQCFMTTDQTKHRYDRQKDMIVGEASLYYAGLPLAGPAANDKIAPSMGAILLGPCTEAYPGRKYVDENLKAGMAPRVLATLLRSVYCRRFLGALLLGDIFADLACVREKVQVDIKLLLDPKIRKSTKEIDIALLNLEECKACSMAGIKKYYVIRFVGLDENQIGKIVEADRLTIALAGCYRKEYAKSFVCIWKQSVQLLAST